MWYNENAANPDQMERIVAAKDRVLDDIVERILSVQSPERILLFGSRARGTGRCDSDFDILVIADSDRPRYERAAPLYTRLADLPVEVDVVVYTPAEVHEWSNVHGAFITTATREGKVIYERPD